jgi:ankyrin repeat protein
MKSVGVPSALVVLMLIAGVAGASDERLMNAVKHQNAQALQALIQQGVDVNGSAADGTTALHWAAYGDEVLIADALLKAGAKVNVATELGVTPLMLACENGHAAMVDRLLRAGADPNSPPSIGEERPLLIAARVGSLETVKLLLAKGAAVNAKEAVQGQTALMWAVAERHSEVARFLLANGADVRAKTKVPGRPSRMAPGAGAPPPADRVAANDNGVGPPPPTGANGFTALLFAARVGDIDSARALLDTGADVNDTAADGMSALLFATVRGHVPMAMFLLDRGANPNLDGAGYTALHWAVGSWESEMSVTNITTEREGDWRYVIGLREGKFALVKALLAHGADPNARVKKTPARAGESKNGELPELVGATPLHLAAMAGDVEAMHILGAGGADPRLKTTANGTILMAAAGLGHVQGESLVKEEDVLAAVKAALELGVDPKATDAVGNTALHYAAYMRHDGSIPTLVEAGAPLEAKSKYEETALWDSQLVVQFSGGGTFQMIPSPATAMLRKLGASEIQASYDYARPTDWPDIARPAISGGVAKRPSAPAGGKQ